MLSSFAVDFPVDLWGLIGWIVAGCWSGSLVYWTSPTIFANWRMLLGGASAMAVSRPTHVPSQKMTSRFAGRDGVADGMVLLIPEALFNVVLARSWAQGEEA